MQKAPKENWKSDPQEENLDPNKSAPSRNSLLFPSLEGFAVIRYLASWSKLSLHPTWLKMAQSQQLSATSFLLNSLEESDTNPTIAWYLCSHIPTRPLLRLGSLLTQSAHKPITRASQKVCVSSWANAGEIIQSVQALRTEQEHGSTIRKSPFFSESDPLFPPGHAGCLQGFFSAIWCFRYPSPFLNPRQGLCCKDYMV